MAKQLFANNASSLLAASIDDNDLAIQVTSTEGALFPNPGAGEFFLVTLVNADGDYEIVKITSRTSDILTVDAAGRGMEGTTPASWTNGVTRVELRNTKGTLEMFIQREGDVMEGDLDMDGNEVKDAHLTGSNTKILAGEIVNVPLRGATGISANEVAVPTDGSQATASGSPILTEARTQQVRTAAFVVGMIMDWYGAAASCPAGWAICDGTNGTPDMRDLVSVGVSGTKLLDSTGGSATASGNTGSSGAHTHGDNTGGTALSVANLPAHHHNIFAANNTSATNADGWDRAGTRGIAGEDVGPFAMREQSNSGDQLISDTGSGTAHTHSISSDGAHTHSLSGVSVMQPYRALHKIMFIGF